ncbi:MAG: Smr/MutS family protein [Deltaproteobacteria bacterium]|nr:Smr/MutS family protein [Deltaproteobacteria bacterium]
MNATNDLEWRALVLSLAGRCLGEAAAARLRLLEPAATRAEARRRHDEVSEAFATLAEGEPLPLVGVESMDELLVRLSRGGEARALELVVIARMLSGARSLRAFLRSRAAILPTLGERLGEEAAVDRELERIERGIFAAIEPHGFVKDEASAELRRARHVVATARKGLGDKLRQLQSDLADVLRDGGPVERDGRIGLPVRSDAHRKVEGIVLGTSATGATLYVEPPEVTSIGNRLRIAESEVEREELRIVSELTASVRRSAEAVERAYESLVHADGLAALASFARDSGAIPLAPCDEPVVELGLARHPLLVLRGGEVVPNDVRVEAGRALVVSGPNAGGKTVALKMLGLAALMVRAGIPVCADARSRVGWFDPVVTDIGDGQSIEQSLSTFSAHVVSYRGMLAAARDAHAAGRHALVLLDEVAGSTDPEEGAALAVALLEAFLGQGAAVATTTHHERLKQRALEDGRFENAAVGFDFDALRPTFGLRPGVVGASAALAAAARHGLPASVVLRAKDLIPKEIVLREQLLADLERERARERTARLATEAELERVRQLRVELEEERANVRGKERKRLQDEAAELRDAIRGARVKLRELDQSRRTGAVEPRAAERIVDEAARVIALGSAVHEATQEARVTGGALDPSEIRPGAKLATEKLGVVQVLEPPERGQVRVRAGAFNLRLPLADLRRAPKSARERLPAPARLTAPVASPLPAGDRLIRTASSTCDLRGMRADAALAEVDRFIDRCLADGEAHGFVLHGHGTGALRQAVREHLALHPNVARARPADLEEGGDAFTAFWVK